MSSRDERERAIAFLRALSLRLARRTEIFPWGVALFEPSLPDVWHLNSAWVDAVPAEVSATALAAELERLQGGAGLRHRQAVVADEASGDRLSPQLALLGWNGTRDLLMAWRRAPDRPIPSAEVVDVDLVGASRFAAALLADSSDLLPADVSEQLVAARTVLAEAGASFSGVAVNGEVVSLCELYVEGETARIGALETLPAHRNRGYARAVISRAVADARAAGCDLVFLEAEELDWPKYLYGQLGFEPVGHFHEFTRPESGASGESPEPLEYGSRSPPPSSGAGHGDGGPS